jgi:hypothetical protein
MKEQFMKKLLFGNLILVALTLSSITFAAEGGVGSGGGGTTNPKPADREWIVQAANQYGAKVITAWLYREEESFLGMSAEEQEKSILVKMFHSTTGKNIYDLIKTTEIEYRMTKPCLDGEGSPADGSIYATHAGAICLSPFTMAPKLNEYNMDAETLALLVHEFSHLMGANEAEAVKIQEQALFGFSRINLLDAVVKLDLLAPAGFAVGGPTDIGMLLTNISIADMDLMGGIAHNRSFSDILRDLLDLRRKLTEEMRSLHYVSPYLSARLTPNMERVIYLESAVCAFDEQENHAMREYCAGRVAKGFGADTTVTLRTYAARDSTLDESTFGPEYAEILLTKPQAQIELRQQMTELKAHVQQIHDELVQLQKLQLKGFRN